MDGRTDLAALVARIGMDDDESHQRSAFLELTAQDRARMAARAGALDQVHAAFIDRLYRHLARFEPLAHLCGDPQTLARLKDRQRDYYRQLWQGPWDEAYRHNRLHIGLVHHREGIELKWYLGAYRLYLDDMLTVLLAPSESRELCRSLLKAAFFDMGLTADTYGAAQRQALEASEARFTRALRGANDGIWDWDIDHDRLYVSRRWAEMLGCRREALDGTSRDWFARVHPGDLPGLRQAIEAHLDGRTAQLHHEYRLRGTDGRYLWMLARGVAEQTDGHRRMAGSQTDIDRRKTIEEQLRHAARHDPLTGLANRARLDELIVQALQHRGSQGARPSALLFIDLDRFKLINDSLGHAVGDQVLVEVAGRLQRCLRPGDHLIRFGGDEFVALLDDLAQPEDAERVAQRLLDSLRQPLYIGEQPLAVSASIGIAPLGHGSVAPLQAADMALYRAKAAGKARFARYSEELRGLAEAQLQLQSDLALALPQGAFSLHYQPICRIDGDSPRIVGTEALLRWRRGEHLMPPAAFIPALEESGLIEAVGDWVLQENCRQTRAWQLAGHAHLYCSVNLSSRQLQQPDFPERLARILDDSGLAPTALVLEITESLLMDDSPALLGSLRRLAGLGIRLALDDFGTGYCSLGYLTRFPLHLLKVDRSFIDGAPESVELATISRAIIGLGASLGLEVIAEGVEREAHLTFLRALGCTQAQGYWFGRPLPGPALQQQLEAQKQAEAAPPQPKNQ